MEYHATVVWFFDNCNWRVIMAFVRVISCFLLCITGASCAFAQVAKIVVPESVGIGHTHLQYDPPMVPGHTHFGIDIMAACGSFIYPLASGNVVSVKKNTDSLGNAVMIRHPSIGRGGSDLYTTYLHMQSAPNMNDKALAVGDAVYSGIPVGKIGDTGFADGCHTHFEIRNFYYPDIAGGGWYHPNSKRCSDGSLNTYACGDQRNAVWAVNDWENPETYQVQQNRCDPTRQRCAIRVYDTIGWFPPVDDCSQASQWFLMGIVNGEKTTVGTTTSAACPQACVISN